MADEQKPKGLVHIGEVLHALPGGRAPRPPPPEPFALLLQEYPKGSPEAKRQMSIQAAKEFVEDALIVRQRSASDANTIGYIARMVMQSTMPHAKTSKQFFVKSNGKISMQMSTTHQGVGLPFGTYPRLLLSWITTEAVQNKSQTLELGDSLSGFMRELGLEPAGGARGSIRALKEHLQRLFCTAISWTFDNKTSELGIAIVPIEQRTLWWDPVQPDQAALWKSSITLNKLFYDAIVERPVPVCLRSLKLLASTKSSLALDIYSWLTYRMSYLEEKKQVSWERLQLQFGGEYAREIDFRRKFCERLKLVKLIYPAAKVTPSDHGLVLEPSPPHVPIRVLRARNSR